MISRLLKLYRQRQLAMAYRRWHAMATIGDHFELGSHAAEIHNESGDRNAITIGHHTRIFGALFCKTGASVTIGNYCQIQNNVSILALESIEIGHFVGIAPFVTIVDNNTHRIEPEERIKHRMRVAPGGPGYPGIGDGSELSDSAPVVIEDVAWVGAHATIMKGVRVGEGSLVARGAMVVKDVEPYTIVAGNPAKLVKRLERPDGDYYPRD